MTLNDQAKAAVEEVINQHKTRPDQKVSGVYLSRESLMNLATGILTLCREDAQRREEEATAGIILFALRWCDGDAFLVENVDRCVAAYKCSRKEQEGDRQ